MARKTVKSKRRNNEGSIYFEESRKKWVASITAPDGSRPKDRFDKWEDADAWLTKIKNSFLENTYVPPSDLTLGQWILQWLTVYIKPKIKREKTFLRYKQTAAHITPVAMIRLQDVTAPVVQKFLNDLPEDMSSSSKNKIYKMISAAFKKASALRMIRYNPIDAVEAPQVTYKDIEIFTWFEMRKIIGKLSLQKTPKALLRHYPLVLFAATTGCRLGEVLGLRWCDLNLNTGTAYITNSLQDVNGILTDCPPKTTAGKRTLALLDEVVKELKKLQASRKLLAIDGSDYVFQSSKGTPFFPSNFNRIWHRILKYCEVDYKNFHVLRHTHATEMLAAGVPLLEVSRRLGHSKASHTLNLYGHAIPGYNNEMAEKLKLVYAI